LCRFYKNLIVAIEILDLNNFYIVLFMIFKTMSIKKLLCTPILLLMTILAIAQTGDIRGFVYDNDNGEPVLFATVYLSGTNYGATTDINGFFNIAKIPAGTYTLTCTYVGYDSTGVVVDLKAGRIVNQSLYMAQSSTQLSEIKVTAKREEARSDVKISTIKVTPKDIKSIPGTGGQADLAQYLQVLPGVIFTGDQGGQLYIRGGSPIQNKILLDGMTIYNPFHSIGFFSVFETEIIRNVEVLTGGFSADYGGRVSAVIDITSRDGNKKRFGGLVGANPFQANVLLEGPIVKLDEDSGTSASFIVTGKHSYLEQTSKSLYSYIDSTGLPFSFTDVYGKVSLTSKTGSKLNLFGFNFRDNVDISNTSNLDWITYGGGTNFKLIPNYSRTIIGGNFAYSKYDITLNETGEEPRESSINSFEIGFDVTSYGKDSEFNAGIELEGPSTAFSFTNGLGNNIEENAYNTNFAGFAKYKKRLGGLVLEPSMRVQYYASISSFSFEPRLGMKVNITDGLRFKFAGGIFSQNLISAVNERDIVNLFVGFLSSPSQVDAPGTSQKADFRYQRSIHAIGGVEIDLLDNLELNIEPYYKYFPQLINVNRNKLNPSDPNYSTEEGDAYGVDFLLRYDTKSLFLWAAYSFGFVSRDDGEQVYPTHFDRRHNINLVGNYKFGAKRLWEAGVRWNIGSGFPFTLTQGFYEDNNFEDGINTDYVSDNGDLGIIYSDDRNSGRLPYYHRMDVSLKRTIEFSKYLKLDIYASATNIYDRENIFYFDRVRYERVNQLPLLPSMGMTVSF